MIPFKNEETFIEHAINSVKEISDEIICINDNSTDLSPEIAKNTGAVVVNSSERVDYGWPELKIRNDLLSIGRDYGGTHFICLDADELISENFKKNINIIKELPKNTKLRMQWIALWKSYTRYKNDNSVWSNNYKDFIFHDDGKTKYPNVWMHTPRTPTSGWNEITIPPSVGCVIHLQFVFWESFQIKQAWYMCSELLENNGENYNLINEKYKITLDPNKFKNKLAYRYYESKTTKNVNTSWYDFNSLPEENLNIIEPNWRMVQMKEWFNIYGVDYFKSLNIWHINELKKYKS